LLVESEGSGRAGVGGGERGERWGLEKFFRGEFHLGRIRGLAGKREGGGGRADGGLLERGGGL